jgi:hypothetical protein
VAQGRLNLKDFATHIPSQHNLTLKLRPLNKKEPEIFSPCNTLEIGQEFYDIFAPFVFYLENNVFILHKEESLGEN